jgi:DNA-directed RNA polymerase subunit M/transcription elongation factor TFIIS
MTCPDCIEKMIPQKKKLGIGSQKWQICPKCGCRLKEDSLITESYKVEVFFKNKDRINENKNDYKEFE